MIHHFGGFVQSGAVARKEARGTARVAQDTLDNIDPEKRDTAGMALGLALVRLSGWK